MGIFFHELLMLTGVRPDKHITSLTLAASSSQLTVLVFSKKKSLLFWCARFVSFESMWFLSAQVLG